MPHLDAAYNLARWLTRNEHEAQDVVQDAFLRAFKFFGGFHGGNSRPWLLSIVRNTTYTWLQKNRKHELATVFDEEVHDIEDTSSSPEALLLKNSDRWDRSDCLAGRDRIDWAFDGWALGPGSHSQSFAFVDGQPPDRCGLLRPAYSQAMVCR